MADTRVWLLTADEAAALRDAGSAAEQDAVMRPIAGRLVAEALDQAAGAIAERCGHTDYRQRGTGDGSFEDRWRAPKIWSPDVCPFCSKDTALVRALAAEYREGKR